MIRLFRAQAEPNKKKKKVTFAVGCKPPAPNEGTNPPGPPPPGGAEASSRPSGAGSAAGSAAATPLKPKAKVKAASKPTGKKRALKAQRARQHPVKTLVLYKSYHPSRCIPSHPAAFRCL